MEKEKKRPFAKYLLHAAILFGVIVAGVKYLNGPEILAALARFDSLYIPLILGISAGYILIKGWRFVFLMRPISDVAWGTLVRGYIAGTAATLLPGGVAARAGLMSQAGVPVERSSAPVAYSSILDQAIFVFGLLAAAVWFEGARTPALIIMGVLLLLAALMLLPPLRRLLGRGADWVATKFKILEKWRHFLSAIREVSTPDVLLLSLLITAVGLFFQIAMLDLAMRGLGLALPYPTLFLAYILPAMLGRLSAVPAGVGLTEAGMVGFLASTAKVDAELATAGAAIFRISTVLFQAILGALVYFFLWRGEGEKVRGNTTLPGA